MRPDSLFDPEFDRSAKDARNPRLRWLTETAIVLVINGSITLLFAWPVLSSPNLGKPSGQGVPAEPPDEANRVVHPLGFSIIMPPNWEVNLYEGSRVLASPRAILPGRYNPMISLVRYGKMKPSDDSGFRPAWFQGQPGLERTSEAFGRRSIRILHYDLMFQRGGEWYFLQYRLPGNRESLPHMIQIYFNTFREDSPAGTAPRGEPWRDGPEARSIGRAGHGAETYRSLKSGRSLS